MAGIREYDAARDGEALRACFIELQDHERAIDARIPRGADIADRYLELMFERCDAHAGLVLVAEEDGRVVGFVTVWTRYRSSEPDDDPVEHGYVSDLVVASTHRGRGIGRALLAAAEARARDAGARSLRLTVKAGNDGASALYAAEGFLATEIELEKRLG